MTNPYSDPTAAVSSIPVKSTSGKVLLGLGLCGSLLTAFIVTFVVPSFSQVFKSFGADLPLATSLIMNFYLFIWAFPVFVLVVFYCWPTPSRRPLWAFLIGVVGAFLIIPLTLVALYFPIFALAAAP